MQYSALESPDRSSGDFSAHLGAMGDFQGVPDSTGEGWKTLGCTGRPLVLSSTRDLQALEGPRDCARPLECRTIILRGARAQ